MAARFDCIVLGVGGFGGGAFHHLARRGANVLGIERFDVAHDRGSSHGETRVIRKAYFEHPDYVPLLHRAYDLWADLAAESGRTLFHQCGLLLAGPPQGPTIAGAKFAAEKYGLEIEDLDAADFGERFPGLRIPEGCAAVLETIAGYLEVENCVRTHIESAQAAGGVLHTGETVTGWKSDGRTVRVVTDRDAYEAASLVVTAGPWASQLLTDLGVKLEVRRKPFLWCPVANDLYDAARPCPAWFYELPGFGEFYAIPSIDGRTIKTAEHTGGALVDDPLAVDRGLHPDDVERLAEFLRLSAPDVDPRPVRHSICMYTNSPDGHFLVDRLPGVENVVFGAGFSGHGFKFTSVLGEALAEMALEGRTELPVEFLSLKRFAPNAG
ncbi:MAG: N-methyl-L-tryptophan oxidase [Planctomycetaceae bacterium]